MRPRFTSAVVRGLLVLAEQAQVEEGRTQPKRRKADQRDRDRALEYLAATAIHRNLEWEKPAPITQEDVPVRSRVVLSDSSVGERRWNVLPEVGEVWEDDDGVRYLVREVTLTRRFAAIPSVIAHAILRAPGGEGRRVTPKQWRRMVGRCRLIKTVTAET